MSRRHLVLAPVTLLALAPVALVALRALGPGQDLVFAWRGLTTEHFSELAAAPHFFRQVANSLAAATATALLGVSLALPAAWALSRARLPGQDPILLGLLALQMFPVTLLILPMYVLLDALGLLDRIAGLVLVYAATSIPFSVWMLKGAVDAVPRDLEEAACVDGASPAGAFLRVVLPLLRPALAVTFLFSFMTAWNEYILAETFLSREAAYTLPVRLQHLVGEYSTRWGTFAAGALLVSAPVVALFYALQRHLVGGLTGGAVKG